MVSPALAPREKRCRVCQEVGAIEDVTWRLFDEDGNHIGTKEATAYCRTVGMDGRPNTLYNRVVAHRKHIDAWLAKQARRGEVMVPLEGEGNTVRIPPRTGPVRWLDLNATTMDVGNDALSMIAGRVKSGLMEDESLIAVARLGVSAAHKQGDWEAKGRKLSQVDELLKLAAGVPRE